MAGLVRKAIPVDLAELNERIVLAYTGANRAIRASITGKLPRPISMATWQCGRISITLPRLPQGCARHWRRPIGMRRLACCGKNGQTVRTERSGNLDTADRQDDRERTKGRSKRGQGVRRGGRGMRLLSGGTWGQGPRLTVDYGGWRRSTARFRGAAGSAGQGTIALTFEHGTHIT